MLFLDGILVSLLVGGIAGWLAGLILRGRGYGVLTNILLGIVGGALANVVLGLFALLGMQLAAWSLAGRIITATLGAMLLIYVLRRFRLLPGWR